VEFRGFRDVTQSDYDPRAMDVAGELADVPADQRGARLDALCGMDEALRARVRDLLNELTLSPRTASTNPTTRPATKPAADDLTPSWFTDADRTRVERVGPFRLIRRIGVGGMSEVYEAEQDRPRRLVALKLIHPLQMSPAMLRRFEFEVEVLGRLEHPGIARVYEAGTEQTSIGPQPYFAMELVRGRRLDHWVAMKQPDLARRLQILIDICDAVQHAHQHGVIHRDLKPSNIMITEDGEAKVLDFGVAAAVEPTGGPAQAAATMHTATGQIIGTLQYMSPEQAAGDVRALDTRSDVYALGVIAYQLLSDRLPYEVSDKPLPEAVRVICDTPPTRLGTIDRSLRGDLETIVFKALAKEKQQRYPSSAELAADVRRFLDYEPITARPPSLWYQARTFARRHTALVASAAVVLLVILVGGIVSTLAYFEARTARAVAEQTNAFLDDMLGSVDPSEAQGREVTVREVLDRAGAQLNDRFNDQPAVEAALRHTIGRTYRNLGLLDRARAELARAVELRRAALGDEHPDTLVARNNLALALDELGESTDAEREHRAILDARRRALGDDHVDTLTSLNNLACTLDDQGRWDASEPLHREALDRRRRTMGADHADALQSQHNLAASLKMSGRAADALPLLRDVAARRAATLGPDHPRTLASAAVLADALVELGQVDEAATLLRDAASRCARVFGVDHGHTLATMSKLSGALRHQRRADEAEAVLAQALERGVKKFGADHPLALQLQNERAVMLLDAGRAAKAEPVLRDLSGRMDRVFGPGHTSSLTVRGNLARALASTNRFAEAELIFRQLMGEGDAGRLPPARAAHFAVAYAEGLRSQGRPIEARDVLLRGKQLLSTAGVTSGPPMPELLEALAAASAEADRLSAPTTRASHE
jgi:serine/threonine protein kinase/tetratricopeptide (TPR) repeat protein